MADQQTGTIYILKYPLVAFVAVKVYFFAKYNYKYPGRVVSRSGLENTKYKSIR